MSENWIIDFLRRDIDTTKSLVRLTDPQTIATEGEEGRVYPVKRIQWIKINDNQLEYAFIDIGDNLWIVFKIVDKVFDVRVYEEIINDDLKSGNGKDMILAGNLWLFEQPASENFAYNELNYTYTIPYNMEIDGVKTDFTYQQKDQGPVYGQCRIFPLPSGLPSKMIAEVVEYQATENNPNPEILILEVGGEDSVDGGQIRLMIGSNIEQTQIEFK